ncbi:MAG: hypothetical protein AAGH88_08920 [Planctomycetota bacterium]
MPPKQSHPRKPPRLHTRVIVTESGECVDVTRIFHGASEAVVRRRARRELRRIIEDVARDHPRAEPLPDEMASALEHGCWWAELGSETFSVLLLTPEAVEFADPPVEIDIQGGRVTEVSAPQGLPILIRDYDTDGVEPGRLTHDADGKPCVETRWNGGDG